MKNLILMTGLLVSSGFVSAQKVNQKMVSEAIKAKVHALYPSAKTITWTKEKGNYEAEFKNGGVTTSALLDSKAELIESEIALKPTELPAAVLNAIKTSFPGKKIAEAAVIDTKGAKSYEAEVGGIDYIYTIDGKLIKSVKD